MIDMIDPDGIEFAKTLQASRAIAETTGIAAIPRAYIEGKLRKKEAVDAGEVSQIENATDLARVRTDMEIMRMVGTRVQEMADALNVTCQEAKLSLIAYGLTNNPQHLVNFGNIVDKSDEMFAEGDEVPDERPSVEWWDRFYECGKVITADELQHFFAAMLTGEIRAPGRISFQTIEVARKLDARSATLFAKWASMSTLLVDSRFLCTLGRAAGNNELREFGFSYRELTKLQALGLIGTDMSAWVDPDSYIGATIKRADHSIRFSYALAYAGQRWTLMSTRPNPENETQDEQPSDDVRRRLDVIFATEAGSELASVIPVEENTTYTEQLKKYLGTKGIRLVNQSNLEDEILGGTDDRETQR